MDTNKYNYYQPRQPHKNRQAVPPPLPAKPKRRWLKRLLLLLLVLIIAAGIWAGWVGYRLFANTPKVFGGTVFSNMATVLRPTTLHGDDQGIVTILLVGNSVDDPGHPASDLTDSIILMRLNTATHKAALLSIPRDLYVELPDHGYRKINEAYHWGTVDNFSSTGYPAGGIGLLEQQVASRMGVPIDYYVLVNYGALRNVVNAVDGVDVTVQSIDARGLFDPNISPADGGPLRLANGPQHMDGQTALNFARARGDPTADGRVGYGFPRSDLDRGDHQRQLLVALQKKLLSTAVLTNPITLGHVFDGLGNNVQTDLQINEARRLADILRSKDAIVQSATLTDPNASLLRNYTTRQGQSALIPAAGVDNYSAIQAHVRTLPE